MKRPPRLHFMHWAPADWLSSRVRMRSIATADPMLRTIYRELLDLLFEAGGSLPNDAAFIADAVALPKAEVERLLPILIDLGSRSRGGLVVSGDEIQNVRVSEDLAAQVAARQKAALDGAKGARARERALEEAREAGRERPELTIARRTP